MFKKEDKTTMATMESYTLYIDETGDGRWPQPFGRSNVKWFVSTGIAFNTKNDLRCKIGR